jgi:hypothetical protein
LYANFTRGQSLFFTQKGLAFLRGRTIICVAGKLFDPLPLAASVPHGQVTVAILWVDFIYLPLREIDKVHP